MKVIVGLGNPGEKYANTRHNLGFRVADALLQKLEPVKETFWDEHKKEKYFSKQVTVKDQKVMLVKPQTFMNLSGNAVVSILEYYKIPVEDLIVVYDDLDLPLGKIRVRFGGAAGGHNGVMSIIERVGSDKFLRVRLGIGHPHHPQIDEEEKKQLKNRQSVEDYVIAPFGRAEEGHAREMVHKAEKTVLEILEHGIETYMSKYNKE
jgi:PTH1 family peptidyl-tRNA hydrolase